MLHRCDYKNNIQYWNVVLNNILPAGVNRRKGNNYRFYKLHILSEIQNVEGRIIRNK